MEWKRLVLYAAWVAALLLPFFVASATVACACLLLGLTAAGFALHYARTRDRLLYRVGVPCVIKRIGDELGLSGEDDAPVTRWDWLEADPVWLRRKYVPAVLQRLRAQVAAMDTPWWNYLIVHCWLIPMVPGLFRLPLRTLRLHATRLRMLSSLEQNAR
jgi:hypothetical protein